jgi:CHRD domain
MISPLIATRGARVAARLATGVLLLALSAAVSAADNFRVRLRPVPIDPATAASTTGEGSATATLDGRKLTLTGTFTGLKGAATVANLHQGRATGVRGPSIAEVKVPSSPSGTFTAELTLSASQADALRQGRVYLQIHSAAAPDGNLWGWLLE